MREKNNPEIIHLVNRFIKNELMVEKWRLLQARKKPKTGESDNHSEVFMESSKHMVRKRAGFAPADSVLSLLSEHTR